MKPSVVSFIKRKLINLPGWRTKRKIVVIESDDWGSIRMASKDAYDHFLGLGYSVDRCPYNRLDSLECNSDLEMLLEVLHSVTDSSGQPACLTVNNIVANPDFERIKEDCFEAYHYEPFIETLNKYPKSDRVLELYRQGIKSGALCPQFHGREHLNVNRWLIDLQNKCEICVEAFKQNMFSVHKSGSIAGRSEYMDAFGLGYNKEVESSKSILTTGTELFENIWGYKSESFIAPCFTWPVDIERILFQNGISFFQGTHVQRVPNRSYSKGIKRKYHYMGQKNSMGQIYMVRNVFFEPVESDRYDWVNAALKQIDEVFQFNKPAIISTHRVNYAGRLKPENRNQNLNLLKQLLHKLVAKYPEVEFLSTPELGRLMKEK